MNTTRLTNAINTEKQLADRNDPYDYDILQTPMNFEANKEMEDYDERLERSFCIFPEENEIQREDFCELSETQQKYDLLPVPLDWTMRINTVSSSAFIPNEYEYPDKHDDVDLSNFTLAESETIIRISLQYGMLYSDVIYYSKYCSHCVNKLCVWNNKCDGLSNS